MSWLDPVVDALDRRGRPVPVFFRDDDAGWDHDGLSRLVHVFGAADCPLDLAVIPAELDPWLTIRLAAWRHDLGIGMHQHGFAHHNREATGRKCEFGPSRPIGRTAADISRGQRRLGELLGDAVDPIFTPPWNRCGDEVADVLVALGFRALSRDLSAGTIGHPGLLELPVAVDWFGHTRGRRWSRGELAARIASRFGDDGPVGIMLHHAPTGADDLRAIGDLVGVVTGHPMASPVAMRALLDVPAGRGMQVAQATT